LRQFTGTNKQTGKDDSNKENKENKDKQKDNKDIIIIQEKQKDEIHDS